MNTPLHLRVLSVSMLLVCVGCPGPKTVTPQATISLPPVLAPIPESPITADEGKPGRLQKLANVEPATRVFVVEPETEGPATAVLLVHSIWGLDLETRSVARDLAASGFVVAAPDLFDGLEPSSRLVTNELLKANNPARTLAILDAALDLLVKSPRSKGQKIVMVGLAVGGQWAMPWLDTDRGLAAVALDSSALMSTPPCRGFKGPMLLLSGAESMSFQPAVLEKIVRTYADAGVTVRTQPIEGAGTDLFDAQARGFSAVARSEALAKLLEFLRTSTR